ncbi:MAG: Stp1/IreP family PP2C-type Ser/Thr phosphatase [Nitrospirae bacterium]|nr:Stp1/IreP family PP2C-type Ser/Thr phosphatase [Nitrospirota bacterium]
MRILWGAATHTGRVRQINEDAFGVYPESLFSTRGPQKGLFVVADGLGGHAGGEIASRLAVDVLRERYPFPSEEGEQHLVKALQEAHLRIQEKASRDPELHRMGTTVVAALIDGDHASIVHLGDSRAYLIRDRRIRQMTRDHTVVEERLRAGLITPEEALTHPYRHILSRALGIEQSAEIDHNPLELRAGDLLLLCSDGLTNMLTDAEILEIILSVSTVSPETTDLTQSLIEAANERGGIDNITVVLIQMKAEDKELAAPTT